MWYILIVELSFADWDTAHAFIGTFKHAGYKFYMPEFIGSFSGNGLLSKLHLKWCFLTNSREYLTRKHKSSALLVTWKQN